MTRRIDEIDHVRLAVVPLWLVLELQRGRGNRDAAILLHVHPVGHSRLTAGLAVDSTGLVNDMSMQRQRLGERGLTGIRVCDDGKCAAACGFFGESGHRETTLSLKRKSE